jgi:hypothetical protein
MAAATTPESMVTHWSAHDRAAVGKEEPATARGSRVRRGVTR